MAKYVYSAENASGEPLSGELEATSREEALRLLRQRGVFEPQLVEEKGPRAKLSGAESTLR